MVEEEKEEEKEVEVEEEKEEEVAVVRIRPFSGNSFMSGDRASRRRFSILMAINDTWPLFAAHWQEWRRL